MMKYMMILIIFCMMICTVSANCEYGYVSIYDDSLIPDSWFGIVIDRINLISVSSSMVILTNDKCTMNTTLSPDGWFEFKRVPAGKYNVILVSGNGGQPELSTVTVREGYTTVLDKQFIGGFC